MAKKTPTKKTSASRSKKVSGSRTAKKKTASKKTAAKPVSKKVSKKAAATKKVTKKVAKKPSAAKTAKKKTTAKKTTSKPSKKVVAKKPTTKKTTTKKPVGKKPAATKTPTKTTATKKTVSKKAAPSASASSKASSKKPAPSKKVETSKKKPASSGSDAASKKVARKGITIVDKKPARRSAPKSKVEFPQQAGGGLLGPNAPKRKPLIPSGPSVTAGGDDAAGRQSSKAKKSPFKKAELNAYKKLLLAKASELIGDVSGLEEGALRGQSGGLSHLPQHVAEFGSDAYEQTLSLDLAAADRRLLKEIDDALGRIADGTYGLCERTGKPIGKARLEELPWARYSIEAARELERGLGAR